ncbi:MAG TPA: 2OG-Fe(II) oxygenase [Vitreimonas sp.]|nr:2OG-Fe(II) oxygenase [Vitreimonas sp.]
MSLVSEPDLEDLKRQASEGRAAAQYALGKRLLVGNAAPFSPREGAAFVGQAAKNGHGEAQCLMAALAARAGKWDLAHNHLEQAAENGEPFARAQLPMLASFAPKEWVGAAATDWRHSAPRIGVLEAFIPPEVCAWIIGRAAPRLQRTRVNDPRDGVSRTLDHRSNSGAGFGILDTDVILEVVNARISAAVGVPANRQEPSNVLHYADGEEYRPHFDFINPAPQFERELATLGQRTTTFLIYLNDDFEGGETDFPRLGWRFKGAAGDALLFWNVNDEGRPEPLTLHAGLAPTLGEKWLFSKWIRDRPAPLM